MTMNTHSAIHRIGNEGRPIMVVDAFVDDVSALTEMARQAAFRSDVRFFPGVQAPFCFETMAGLVERYQTRFRSVFGGHADYQPIECGFALVTTPPEHLAPLQRIPHIDTTDDTRIAVLVYLGGAEFGGTAFYRHRSTGYEWLNAARLSHYNAMLDADVAKFGPPSADYISGDTDLFEQIAAFDAQPGRAIIYKSNSLHSGKIDNAGALSADPLKGRLTLNAFFTTR